MMLCCFWSFALQPENVYMPKAYPEFESRSLRKNARTWAHEIPQADLPAGFFAINPLYMPQAARTTDESSRPLSTFSQRKAITAVRQGQAFTAVRQRKAACG